MDMPQPQPKGKIRSFGYGIVESLNSRLAARTRRGFSSAPPSSCYTLDMNRGIAKQNLPVVVLFGLMAASLAGLLLLPALPAGSKLSPVRRLPHGGRHSEFLERRFEYSLSSQSVPRACWRFRDDPATVVLFLGFFLTGIGSSYYHWDPNDGTLFWDRLPMTLSFAAILASWSRSA